MSGVPVLLALGGMAGEELLVSALDGPGSGVTVVRRCVDLADLLGAASANTAAAVVVGAGLRRLDHQAVERLRTEGLLVVAVVAAQDEEAERRIRMLGVSDVVALRDEDSAAALAALLALLREGVRQVPALPAQRGPSESESEVGNGRLVAVWGPTGAPGRTTVATYLACETAGLGLPTLLADADTYGGAVAQLLGLLDESPGLAAAARAVTAGTLDLPALAQAARQVGPHLRVLTGIVRADRWPELRPAALAEIWTKARSLAAVTVVDCGFGLEQDEELTYDTRAPRRNGATLATLQAADVLVAVGRADPVGVQRLVRSLPDARAAAPSADLRVVLTRVRKGPVGRDVEGQLRESLARHAGVTDVVLVREDQRGYDEALSAGRSLQEVAPKSPARATILALARDLTAPLVAQPGRRRRGRRPVAAERRGGGS